MPTVMSMGSESVTHRPDTPCRIWRGYRNPDGYGKKYVGKKYGRSQFRLLHCWIWEQVNGPIPRGLVVLHRCDKPACFRLDHLQLGTQSENVRDMWQKGRGRAGSTQAARTHCPQGHPYDERNTKVKGGGRHCRRCASLSQQRRYRRLKNGDS